MVHLKKSTKWFKSKMITVDPARIKFIAICDRENSYVQHAERENSSAEVLINNDLSADQTENSGMRSTHIVKNYMMMMETSRWCCWWEWAQPPSNVSPYSINKFGQKIIMWKSWKNEIFLQKKYQFVGCSIGYKVHFAFQSFCLTAEW